MYNYFMSKDEVKFTEMKHGDKEDMNFLLILKINLLKVQLIE